MMRRLNRLAREDGLPTALYQKAFKHELAKGVLAERSREESKLVLPPELSRVGAARGGPRRSRRCGPRGVNVVGDLEELEPVRRLGPRPAAADIPDAVLLDISLAALVSHGAPVGPARDMPASCGARMPGSGNGSSTSSGTRAGRPSDGMRERRGPGPRPCAAPGAEGLPRHG